MCVCVCLYVGHLATASLDVRTAAIDDDKSGAVSEKTKYLRVSPMCLDKEANERKIIVTLILTQGARRYFGRKRKRNTTLCIVC